MNFQNIFIHISSSNKLCVGTIHLSHFTHQNSSISKVFHIHTVHLPFLFKINTSVDKTATLTGSPSHRSNSLSGGNSLFTSSANIKYHLCYSSTSRLHKKHYQVQVICDYHKVYEIHSTTPRYLQPACVAQGNKYTCTTNKSQGINITIQSTVLYIGELMANCQSFLPQIYIMLGEIFGGEKFWQTIQVKAIGEEKFGK